jgi:predicted MFS family arabinose efflux permease
MNVWMLGLTSLVTDISSEMVTSILPAYLIFARGISPSAFGVLDGLHQGGASLARLLSGLIADRLRRYKEVAAIGYLASTLSRVGLLLAGAAPAWLMSAILLDRVGKGVRTSPRDALISLSAPPGGLATAFGVHRTLDTVGATLGPLVAFGILWFTQRDYEAVLVVSVAVALIGLAVLLTFVTNPPHPETTAPTCSPSDDTAQAMLRQNRPFRALAACSWILGAVTLSDSLIYLALQRQTGLQPIYLPLLYVVTPAAYACAAAPVGLLADRIGRNWVLMGGHMALALLYAVLLLPAPAWVTGAGVIGLLGLYYAATDGVLPALGSVTLPRASRATGLSVIGTAQDMGRLTASLGFGWLWSRGSMTSAVAVYLAALLVALLTLWPTVRRLGSHSE